MTSNSGHGKILVVDDNRVLLDLYREVLEAEGFHVITTESPMCVPIISRDRPQIILLDVQMPGLSGDMVGGILKKHADLTHESVVLLHSGLQEETLKKLAEQCGADGYIPKGVSNVELVKRLRRWLAELELRHERRSQS